jgi:nicotinamidase-related amidase
VDNGLPIPPHFDPDRVGEVWRVPYAERAEAADRWAAEHQLTAAADDRFRICLVIVDCQNTFCTPGFELFVAGRSGMGAVEDSRRLCEFIYRNLGQVTRILPTLDTHQATQIFHSLFLVDADGNHPAPYTLVSADDVERGAWRVNSTACRALGIDEDYAQRHLRHYVRQLAESGKYQLTVWPYHAMLGGIGHALVSAIDDAIFFHSIARHSSPDFHVKGEHPLTEHYSMLGPEVTEGPDGEPLEGLADRAPLIAQLREFDAVVVAGQAKSHCVAWTIDDLLDDFGDLARTVYLLEDCTSPVVVPGVVDYTDDADAAFRRFTEAGMHVVRSTDPIANWPGVLHEARARA